MNQSRDRVAMTFLFPDFDTLRLALTGGAVPPAVSLAPARAGTDNDGRPWVTPVRPPSRTLQAALRRLGAIAGDTEPPGGAEVAHWLQAIPLRRDPAPPALTDQSPVLFELADAAQLAPLVGEMLRLGNDRQGIRYLSGIGEVPPTDTRYPIPDTRVLLRVVGPPYYTLLRALDQLGPAPPRAYLERAPRVWVEAGYQHPLGDLLRAPEGQVVLLQPPAEWIYLDDAPFRDVYDVLEFGLPDRPREWADAPPAGKLSVPLRLAPAAPTDAAELWVLGDDGPAQIDELVREADDALLSRLAFAVGDRNGRRVAVLRARPGKSGPPTLALNALACRPYLRLPNLFVPLGARLRPPLRRDAVRVLLADDPATITWLIPQDDGTFTPQSLPDDAFRPLSDWVEYVIDSDVDRLTEWVQAARFDFDSFVSAEVVVPAGKATPRDRRGRGQPDVPLTEDVSLPPATVRPKKTEAELPGPVAAFTPGPAATPGESQQRLKAAELQFLALKGPLDAPERLRLWPELARLNVKLGQTIDAAACWLNALWEPAESIDELAWGWARSEKALPTPTLTAADLDRLLAPAQPTTPDLRPLAASLVWAATQMPVPAALQQRLPDVLRYLETHDRLLPVRAAWLAWSGLTRLAGADVLALARTRDRLLERLLTEGLSPERDLPSFLRYAGQHDADRLRTVRERAERLRQMAHTWFPKSLPLIQGELQIGKYDQTPAYFDLMFAFGMARLGEAEASRALLRQSAEALEAAGGETHSVLLQGFQYRIDEVLSGRPHGGSLPVALIEYLDHLREEYIKSSSAPENANPDKWAMYIVDRLREQSRILEPQERFKPYRYTDRTVGENLSREIAAWPDITAPRVLRSRVEALLGRSAAKPLTGPERVQALQQAIPLASRVGEELSLWLLREVPAAVDAIAGRTAPELFLVQELAILLERALVLAGHYDVSDLVGALLDRLVQLVQTHTGPQELGALARPVGQSLRSLRKFGMRDAAERLLNQVTAAVMRGKTLTDLKARAARGWPQVLEMLLQLAAGRLDFDHPDQAWPVMNEARAFILAGATALKGDDLVRYVSVVCSYVTALGHAPVEEAVGRVEELFTEGRTGTITNGYTSSSHYSRFHLNIVEAVVLALATEEFALGPAARRWLDDDEYLVRRRIHRDVKAALAQAGLS